MFFRVGVDDGVAMPGFFRAGFHIGFQSCTVSVQFGQGSYCDNRFIKRDFAFDEETGGFFGKNAEVAVIDNDGNFLKGWPHSDDCDSVAGWLTTEEVLEVLNWAKDYKPASQPASISSFPQLDSAS